MGEGCPIRNMEKLKPGSVKKKVQCSCGRVVRKVDRGDGRTDIWMEGEGCTGVKLGYVVSDQ